MESQIPSAWQEKIAKEPTGASSAILTMPETESIGGDFRPIHSGYGRCLMSYCNCPEYGGQDNLCSNCGHNYTDHE
jgi:hypothetical protein